jgi:hypothetical protein
MAKASKSATKTAPPAAAAKANVEKKEKKASKAAPVVSLPFLCGSSTWDLV